jgi:hypothetical protein
MEKLWACSLCGCCFLLLLASGVVCLLLSLLVGLLFPWLSAALYKNNSSYFKLLARSHFLDGYLAWLHSKSHEKRSHAKRPLKLDIVYPQTLHGKSHVQIQQRTGRSGEQWRRDVDGLGLVGLGFSSGSPAGFFVFL